MAMPGFSKPLIVEVGGGGGGEQGGGEGGGGDGLVGGGGGEESSLQFGSILKKNLLEGIIA